MREKGEGGVAGLASPPPASPHKPLPRWGHVRQPKLVCVLRKLEPARPGMTWTTEPPGRPPTPVPSPSPSKKKMEEPFQKHADRLAFDRGSRRSEVSARARTSPLAINELGASMKGGPMGRAQDPGSGR